MRRFVNVLVNTAVANVTTSYLWFALTFWVYLETRSVLATGIVGGAYMMLVAVFGMVFGSIVDRMRKHRAMLLASGTSLVAFSVAGVIYLLVDESAVLNLSSGWFWLFSGVILFGAVIENMRNIALSTTVTLLVPEDRHANANGLVGTVQGLAFLVTSVLSGLSIAFVGMGGTLLIAVVVTTLVVAHLLVVRIPESTPNTDERVPILDIAGAVRAIRLAPGLFALIIFATINNLIGGVFVALMDPYGLELFAVAWWGAVLGLSSVGFIVGGIFVAKFGLGRNPIRTMLLFLLVMGFVGTVFTVREVAWLYVLGIFLYMMLVPAIEAAEQTVIQRVVDYRTQGRVFGFASALEAAAAPITAFLIAPIAEFVIIPAVDSADGQRSWEWLLGEGSARGIALIFVVAGLVNILIVLIAFATRSYRTLSATFAGTTSSQPAADPGSDAIRLAAN